MTSAPAAFPFDPMAELRRAVADIDAGRDKSAADRAAETWHGLPAGDGLRVVAATVIALALATGEAREFLRSLLPAISIRCVGRSLGGEHFRPADVGGGDVVSLRPA